VAPKQLAEAVGYCILLKDAIAMGGQTDIWTTAIAFAPFTKVAVVLHHKIGKFD